MSKTTLTLLTQGTVWQGLRPKWFQCSFSEDASIARVEFQDAGGRVMDVLLNVLPDTPYDVGFDADLHRILFIPDDVAVEKRLRITNIKWDMQYRLLFDPQTTQVFMQDGTQSYPVAVTLASGAKQTDFSGVTFANGVGSGFVGLVPGSLFGLYLYLNGALVGRVVTNTATTVTLDRAYTNSTPAVYRFYTWFGDRYLARCGVPLLVHPPAGCASQAGCPLYAAPPVPFSVEAGSMMRTSNVPVTEFASIVLSKMGTNFTL